MDDFWEWFLCNNNINEYNWIAIHKENWKLDIIGHMEKYLALKGIGVGLKSNTFQKMSNGVQFEDIHYETLKENIERQNIVKK